jgi:hypothetical protein
VGAECGDAPRCSVSCWTWESMQPRLHQPSSRPKVSTLGAGVRATTAARALARNLARASARLLADASLSQSWRADLPQPSAPSRACEALSVRSS